MEHFLTRAMNKGNCRKLIGNMVFFLTYVSDSEYTWSEEEIRKASQICIASLKKMTRFPWAATFMSKKSRSAAG